MAALYPSYLPTRPDGLQPVTLEESFDGHEPGLRALQTSKSYIRVPSTKMQDMTPRIGTEIRGVQLSKLPGAGLDEVALLAAQRGVLVFVRLLRTL